MQLTPDQSAQLDALANHPDSRASIVLLATLVQGLIDQPAPILPEGTSHILASGIFEMAVETPQTIWTVPDGYWAEIVELLAWGVSGGSEIGHLIIETEYQVGNLGGSGVWGDKADTVFSPTLVNIVKHAAFFATEANDVIPPATEGKSVTMRYVPARPGHVFNWWLIGRLIPMP